MDIEYGKHIVVFYLQEDTWVPYTHPLLDRTLDEMEKTLRDSYLAQHPHTQWSTTWKISFEGEERIIHLINDEEMLAWKLKQ